MNLIADLVRDLNSCNRGGKGKFINAITMNTLIEYDTGKPGFTTR